MARLARTPYRRGPTYRLVTTATRITTTTTSKAPASTTQLVHFARPRDRLSIVGASYPPPRSCVVRPRWLRPEAVRRSALESGPTPRPHVQAIRHYLVARAQRLCSPSSSDFRVVAGLALFPQGAIDPTSGVGAFLVDRMSCPDVVRTRDRPIARRFVRRQRARQVAAYPTTQLEPFDAAPVRRAAFGDPVSVQPGLTTTRTSMRGRPRTTVACRGRARSWAS